MGGRPGVWLLCARSACAEIGDFARFKRPGQLMSYLGLVPSERSSGQTRRQGQITKSGSISWQARQRLHRTWQRLDHERGKRRTIVAVAVARELAGFCWAAANAD
jgi:transposase